MVDNICGAHDLPLFVLHDFDVAGFLILGTLQRDTRRYQFSSRVEVVDLGLRLEDIADLEREPAAATRTGADMLREQLAENGATDAEIEILLNERVELNAMTSDALVEMIERKLQDYGLEKVVPGDDLLAEAYRAFHRSRQLREKFAALEKEFDAEKSGVDVPPNLKAQDDVILDKHPDLRWDNAIQIVLDETQLDRVRADKYKSRQKSGRLHGCRRRKSRKQVRLIHHSKVRELILAPSTSAARAITGRGGCRTANGSIPSRSAATACLMKSSPSTSAISTIARPRARRRHARADSAHAA